MEENDVELEPGPVGELEYISNKMREVNIKELSRGFVVKVGC
jgi:hypothetical protein